ncbi:MAG: hypothetical protein IT373_37385 [Polyangiaceae bacterium]|nr:hypothetical protein [Polyangiaceae bacterium]
MSNRIASWAPLATTALAMAGCSLFAGGSAIGTAACPALRQDVDAFAASYAANPQVNAKLRAFVQATKDLAGISGQMEAEATAACQRIGADLGLAPGQMAARNGPGGGAEGACDAVAAHISGILRQGVQVRATVQPPVCQASAQAQARCAGSCDVANDAECRASCQAHADVNASCTPPLVVVQGDFQNPMAMRLVASLQAHLPTLVHAQMALGQRLLQDAQVIAHIGAELPRMVGDAGAAALACIAAAADFSAAASMRIQVSVRASVRVTGQVGAG